MAEMITIDASGRVVIPARVRRELALAAGTELELELDGETIQLRPVVKSSVAKRHNRLVIRSSLAGSVPDHRDLREERLASLGDDAS